VQQYINKRIDIMLQRRLLVRRMQESMLRQNLQVRVARDTRNIQSSDWPK